MTTLVNTEHYIELLALERKVKSWRKRINEVKTSSDASQHVSSVIQELMQVAGEDILDESNV